MALDPDIEIVTWCMSSARYFSALSKGESLPVKDRLEMNVATQKTDTGLTPGLLKILHKQVFYSTAKQHRSFPLLFVAVKKKPMNLMHCILSSIPLFSFCSVNPVIIFVPSAFYGCNY